MPCSGVRNSCVIPVRKRDLASFAFSAWSRASAAAGGTVLAALPLFFAWRSLVNYFYLVPLLALAAVLVSQRRMEAAVET